MIKLKKIPKFPSYYISDSGEIYSKNKKIKKLAQVSDKDGYLIVCLYNNKIHTNKKIHRLVAEVFIPNPDNKPQVNHKNGIKTDNRVENLEWVTSSENIQHAYDVLHKKNPSGQNNSQSKIVLQIFNNKVIAQYYGIREAERKTGVGRASITRCCTNKQKTAGKYNWKYK